MRVFAPSFSTEKPGAAESNLDISRNSALLAGMIE
jgi:hypothetical protein